MPFFKECTAMMEKYFGLNAEYFLEEMMALKCWREFENNAEMKDGRPDFSKVKDIEWPTLRVMDLDEPIDIESSFVDRLYSIFDGVKGRIPESKQEAMAWTLILVATILEDKNYDSMISDSIASLQDEWMYDCARTDLLKLYIFANDGKYEYDATNNQMDCPIVIKRGGNQLELRNSNDWFRRSMLAHYFNTLLPDIKSVEQAKEELEELSVLKKGRRPENPKVNILIQGITTMFNEELTMVKQMPNELAFFILDYLQMMGYITEEEVSRREKPKDDVWIRSQASYIMKHPVEKFITQLVMHSVPLTYEEVKETLDRPPFIIK